MEAVQFRIQRVSKLRFRTFFFQCNNAIDFFFSLEGATIFIFQLELASPGLLVLLQDSFLCSNYRYWIDQPVFDDLF